jgi:prepilin-type N-terminal cleavage/methylation domain-containing protein
MGRERGRRFGCAAALPDRAAGARRRQRGLTLAELLAALALLAVVAGTAVPSLSRTLTALRLPLAAHRLAADLQLARAGAVLRNTRARVTFEAAGYMLHFDAGAPAEVAVPLPPHVRVASVPRTGMVRFYPAGNADNGTVVLRAASGATRSVVVNQRGRVSIR